MTEQTFVCVYIDREAERWKMYIKQTIYYNVGLYHNKIYITNFSIFCSILKLSTSMKIEWIENKYDTFLATMYIKKCVTNLLINKFYLKSKTFMKVQLKKKWLQETYFSLCSQVFIFCNEHYMKFWAYRVTSKSGHIGEYKKCLLKLH